MASHAPTHTDSVPPGGILDAELDEFLNAGRARARARALAGFSEASPKKSGRPRDTAIRDDLRTIVRAVQPCTVRQAFYQATVSGVVPKTEKGYDKVVRLLSLMRLEGDLPWAWIADNTRWMRKPETYANLADATSWWASGYRRDLAPALGHIEVWLEKDALSGVVYPVTDQWDVPLMVTRGYSSLSFLHSAAESWSDDVTVYYLGDHDPSGRDIDRSIEARLREFAPEVDLTFKRIAVTEDQIKDWSLPSRITKKSDTRARNWSGGDSVELDAIPPDVLRDLVALAIEQHVDAEQLAQIRIVEAAERKLLREFRSTVTT